MGITEIQINVLDLNQKGYKDVTNTAVFPHKNLGNLSKDYQNQMLMSTKINPCYSVLNEEQVREKRKELLKLQSKVRKQTDSLYLNKMKKMAKKVSTIIFHHILHSHKHIPKASEGAMLFSESTVKAQPKEHQVYIMGGAPCISPSFVFHNEVSKPSVKDSTFSKYKIFEFISVIIGCMHLHLECVLLALVYLEKLMTEASVEIRVSNWKPLLLTCIILA